MLDPVGGFERMKEFFISYIETAFRIADPATAAARRELLRRRDVIATVPFIEPVPRYESSDRALESLIAETDILGPLSREGRIAFVELALSGLFEGSDCADGRVRRKSNYNPFVHQEEMLRRGLLPGQPGIVTSGTGSGKTESFMLPVFAQIAREAIRWPRPPEGYLTDKWWREGSGYVPRRTGEPTARPRAIRALILYPMNALVEDQMVRLRKALDSDAAHRAMNERFSGNRVFFGQYTSATPVTGHARHPRRFDDPEEKERHERNEERLARAMRRLSDNQDAARAHDADGRRLAAERGEQPPEPTRFIFASVDGGEMVSRWDMQEAPPDILVTNASMLGTMLSREVEDGIFEQTRAWLERDPDAYFYLVVDELHLIRGSAGTEIAFLLRSLFERLGLDHPDRTHKVRILASSASLPLAGERGRQSVKYLSDLFARYGTSRKAGDRGPDDPEFWRSCVTEGKPHLPRWAGGRLPAAPFRELVDAAAKPGTAFVAEAARSERLESAVAAVAAAFGIRADDFEPSIAEISQRAAEALVHACRQGDDTRAASIADIADRAFAAGEGDVEAVRGLLLARALPEAFEIEMPRETPSFRFHGFVRNVDGLFGAPSRRRTASDSRSSPSSGAPPTARPQRDSPAGRACAWD